MIARNLSKTNDITFHHGPHETGALPQFEIIKAEGPHHGHGHWQNSRFNRTGRDLHGAVQHDHVAFRRGACDRKTSVKYKNFKPLKNNGFI